MHGCSTERFVIGFFAGRHLHERWPSEEDLCSLITHSAVLTQAGHVGATGGRIAEHESDGGDAQSGELGEVVEDLAGGDEEVSLRLKVGATGLDEIDHWQPVLPSDL